MSQKHKSAIVGSLVRPRSIKGREVKSGKKRGEHGTGFVTTHHPESASVEAGLNERRALLQWRAMELRIHGSTLREIGQQLQIDFELEAPVPFNTVDDWLDNAFAETMTAKQKDSDRHCELLITRSERLIKELFPIALGKVVVSRRKVVDGEELEVLDERAIEERLKSTAEIRKLMDQQAKLLRIGRVGAEAKDGESGAAISGHNLTLLVERTVTNNIIFPGQTASGEGGKVLLLASGDEDVDLLDAEALGPI